MSISKQMSFLVITKKQTRSLLLWSMLLISAAPAEAVMVRSPSGDRDILALFLGHDFGDIRVLVDNRTGKSRKVIDITSSTLPNIQKQALISICI